MNPVLIVTHNCIALTHHCVKSVEKQSISTTISIIDNGSTDGTREWLLESPYEYLIRIGNKGVSSAWNIGLTELFKAGAEHVLVVNNDTVLPPWFYQRLVDFDTAFVTGVSVGSMEEIATEPQPTTMMNGPDFSAFLIKKAVFNEVGQFDEEMVMYCQDLDYHIRAHRIGFTLFNGHIPFFHKRSSTLNSSPDRERRLIEMRADADRAVFAEKWGVGACSKEYEALFAQESFGIDKMGSR